MALNIYLHNLELQLADSSKNEGSTSIIIALTKSLHGPLCQQLVDTLLKRLVLIHVTITDVSKYLRRKGGDAWICNLFVACEQCISGE